MVAAKRVVNVLTSIMFNEVIFCFFAIVVVWIVFHLTISLAAYPVLRCICTSDTRTVAPTYSFAIINIQVRAFIIYILIHINIFIEIPSLKQSKNLLYILIFQTHLHHNHEGHQLNGSGRLN